MRNLSLRLSSLRPTSSAMPLDPPAPEPQSAGLSAVPPLRPRVEIPVCDPAPDAAATQALRDRGCFLARQDEWEEIAEKLTAYDKERALTPGLKPSAEPFAEGACQDIVRAARGAVGRQEYRAAQTVLNALEVYLDEMPDDPAMAYVIAEAHLETARLWQGNAPLRTLAATRRNAFDFHMKRVTELADRFDPFEHDSALWARVRCRLLCADPSPAQRVKDDYEDLIDLDPHNPAALMALGHDLLPSRFGSWESLEREARRTAGRLADIWGTGAYTLVYIGALERDRGAFRRMDSELFVSGLHDILSKHPTQHTANRLAAFTGLSISGGDLERGSAHERVHSCFAWIVQDHLREMHPLVWATTHIPGTDDPKPEDHADMIRRGRSRAITSLAEFYAPALDAGRRLIFTPDGVQMLKGR